MEMKHVGVREFRDKATHYLKLGEPLAIERHGEVIGYYLPVRKDPEEVRRKLEAFERALERFLEEGGLTEEEFVELIEKAGKKRAG